MMQERREGHAVQHKHFSALAFIPPCINSSFGVTFLWGAVGEVREAHPVVIRTVRGLVDENRVGCMQDKSLILVLSLWSSVCLGHCAEMRGLQCFS